jgi:hypothetical protein
LGPEPLNHNLQVPKIGTDKAMNGTVTTLAVTGTYTENSNCLGTWRITPKGGTASNFNTIRVNSGSELLLIQTDNNTITAGRAQQ